MLKAQRDLISEYLHLKYSIPQVVIFSRIRLEVGLIINLLTILSAAPINPFREGYITSFLSANSVGALVEDKVFS